MSLVASGFLLRYSFQLYPHPEGENTVKVALTGATKKKKSRAYALEAWCSPSHGSSGPGGPPDGQSRPPDNCTAVHLCAHHTTMTIILSTPLSPPLIAIDQMLVLLTAIPPDSPIHMHAHLSQACMCSQRGVERKQIPLVEVRLYGKQKEDQVLKST